MSRRATHTGRRRRGKTYLWVAVLAIVTVALIYYEQAAIIYILATLGVTALLVVVAMSDLKGKVADEPLPADDAAAIGSGISAASTQTATAARPSRTAKRK